MKHSVATANAPKAIGPYSQAVRTRNMLFTSGQIAIDPATGNIIEGGIREQTERVMRNIQAILREAGIDFSAVVRTTVYLRDMNDFAAMNEVYGSFFEQPFPARSTVEVARLPKDVLVEIDTISCL